MRINLENLKSEFGKVFESPFEFKSSLIRKVAFVAFHTLTLGIPYAIYHIVDYRFPKVDEVATNLKEIALNGLERKHSKPIKGQISPYTFVEWEAINFAEKKLKEHPEFVDKNFFENYFADDKANLFLVEHYKKGPPTNPKISALVGIYKWYQVEIQKLFRTTKDPWNNTSFIKLYDEYLKISFAISILTLEDLEALTTKMPIGERALYRTLTRQDAYPFIAFGFGINAYVLAKNEGVWTGVPKHEKYPDEPLHDDQFYTKDTIQNRWNKLYNAFCNRFRMYASEEDIIKDSRNEDRPFKSTKLDLKKGVV